MVSTILNFFKSKIVTNFIYLVLLQGLSFLLPIIILPFLTLKLGYEKIGSVYFAQALMSYLLAIPEYGFNITATQEVSINRNSKYKLSEIFTLVFFAKIILTTLSFIILVILNVYVKPFKFNPILFYGSFLIVIGQTFFPVFFFQGIEEMRYIAILNFITKVIFSLMIFCLIKSKKDYIYVNVILGLGAIITAIIANLILFFKYNLRIIYPSFNNILLVLKNSGAIFISNFAMAIYMNSTVFILGIYSSKYNVGLYSIAEKIYLSIRQILSIFSQTIFPQASLAANISAMKLFNFYKKTFIPFFVFFIILLFLVFLSSSLICHFLVHKNDPDLIFLINVFLILAAIVAINIPAFQATVLYEKKYIPKIFISAALISVIFNVILNNIFKSYYGTVVSIFTTEIYIALLLYLTFVLNKKLTIKKLLNGFLFD